MAIHRHVHQNVYDWAGELEFPHLERSINRTLDRLARENYLKGNGASKSEDAALSLYSLPAGSCICTRNFGGQDQTQHLNCTNTNFIRVFLGGHIASTYRKSCITRKMPKPMAKTWPAV